MSQIMSETSTCTCYSDEGSSIWKRLVKKYERRIAELNRQKCEISHRLEVMQMQLPAQLCRNMMQAPGDAVTRLEEFIKKQQRPKKEHLCKCDPCPVKIPDNFPKNLFEYSYSYPPKRPITYSQSKPKTKKEKKSSCTCAERVTERLKREDEKEKKAAVVSERSNSIKRICNCELCRKEIPEKLPAEKPTKLERSAVNKLPKLSNAAACMCATDLMKKKGSVNSDVCKCDACAAAVLERIKSPDLIFEPVTCGCEGNAEPEPEPEVDIPICQCNSCKAELNKRMREEAEVTKDCSCKTHIETDEICNCSICAENAVKDPVTDNCACKIDEGLPICSCDTCKKVTQAEPEEPKEDIESRCICHCQVCNEHRRQTEELSKAPSFGETCICDCIECTGKRMSDGPATPCDGPSPPPLCTCIESIKSVSCSCSLSDIIPEEEEECICIPKDCGMMTDSTADSIECNPPAEPICSCALSEAGYSATESHECEQEAGPSCSCASDNEDDIVEDIMEARSCSCTFDTLTENILENDNCDQKSSTSGEIDFNIPSTYSLCQCSKESVPGILNPTPSKTPAPDASLRCLCNDETSEPRIDQILSPKCSLERGSSCLCSKESPVRSKVRITEDKCNCTEEVMSTPRSPDSNRTSTSGSNCTEELSSTPQSPDSNRTSSKGSGSKSSSSAWTATPPQSPDSIKTANKSSGTVSEECVCQNMQFPAFEEVF